MSSIQGRIVFDEFVKVEPFKLQLFKWIGNKQRFAHEIASYFPRDYGTYIEPFLGSGAVLGTLAPRKALASDCFVPLMEIWKTLHSSPNQLIRWYTEGWNKIAKSGKEQAYEDTKASYNAKPNGKDFIFLCRACYGGVVRFRKADGYMSTPCGVHSPVPPDSFSKRVKEWNRRTQGANFASMDFQDAMTQAKPGDLVYCDPPYSHSQAILYGAQSFSLERLLNAIADCKTRDVSVALSIDGTKKSGQKICDVTIPDGLFEREVTVNCGRSMLKRFQMDGKTLESEIVTDRLLLTY